MVNPPSLKGSGNAAVSASDPAHARAPTPHAWLVCTTPDRQRVLSLALQGQGVTFDIVGSDVVVERAMSAGERPACLVVDVAPDGAALPLLPCLRRALPVVPILALISAGCGSVVEQVLDAGASDFCDQSAPPWELPARVQALCRPRTASGRIVQVGDLALDIDSRSARRGGLLLTLTTRQFDLLLLLMQHAGEILSPARIEAALDLPSRARGSNVVEVHVHHLRRRIGPGRLSTLRGKGYVLHATPAEGN
jgi:DNA-binding response OmpR family regulator